MTEKPDPGWIAIARILRPQGRRGEVLAELLTDLDPAVQFAAGRLVALVAPAAPQPVPDAPLTAIQSHWLPVGKNAGRIVLQLSGCDTISQAELLAGQRLMVPVADLPALEPDTFYVNDLLGCTLFNDGQPVGSIVDVHFASSPDGRTRLADAAPLLCVALTGVAPDAEPVLVPFVRSYLDSIDLAARRIMMHLPAGLLDAPNEAEK